MFFFKPTNFSYPSTLTLTSSATVSYNQNPSQIDKSSDLFNAYFIMEIIASFWFTIDYILRFYSAPMQRRKFILIPFNIIDILINLIFVEIIVSTLCFPNSNNDWNSALRIFQIFRIVRVIKTSAGIKAFGYTIKKSLKELLLLISIIFSTAILLGSFVYLAEKGEPQTEFDSLPASFYWAIITVLIFFLPIHKYF